jgi:GH43 family beta-xylosidase
MKPLLLTLPLFSLLHGEPAPLLFEDDFQRDPARRYTIHGGNWAVQDGCLCITGDATAPKAIIRDVNVSAFELEVEISAEDQTQAGVIFHVNSAATGADAYQGYYVGLHAGANQVVWGASDASWREIARRAQSVPPQSWQLLRLIVSGQHVKAYLNELPVSANRFPKFDGLDSGYDAGQIGLRVMGGAARFRSLKVRQHTPRATGGTYTNPVQSGCADPMVILRDGTYYAYCTHTLDYPTMPNGIRLHTSSDLAHWTDRGYVLKNEDSWGDSKFWAPDIIEKDGTYHLYYAADTRMCTATASTPMGLFKQREQKPIEPDSIRIDGHVFENDDGQRYFYYVKFNKGNEIWGGKLNADVTSVDPDSLRLMIKPDQDWERHQAPVVEGPVILKHQGTYYLTYSGSHFESPNYAVGYATSDSPLGPWKKHEFNPIMKSTSYAHGTAHHAFTKSPDGREMFIVYHRHRSLTETEPRQLSIDRAQFVPQENGPALLEIHGPTSTPQPLPSGAQ